MKKDPYEKLYKKGGRNTQSVIYTPRDTMPLQIAPQEYEEYRKAIEESEWAKQQPPMPEPKPKEEKQELKLAPKFEVQKPETPIAERMKTSNESTTPKPQIKMEPSMQKLKELLNKQDAPVKHEEISVNDKIKELTSEFDESVDETEDIFSSDNIEEKFDLESVDFETNDIAEDEGLFEEWFEEDEDDEENEKNKFSENTAEQFTTNEPEKPEPQKPESIEIPEADNSLSNNKTNVSNNDIIKVDKITKKIEEEIPPVKKVSRLAEKRQMELQKKAKEAAQLLFDAEKRKQANIKKLETEKALLKATADKMPDGKDKTKLETAYGEIEISSDPSEVKKTLHRIKTYNKSYKRFNEGRSIDPKKNILRIALIVLFLGIALFSGIKLFLIFAEYKASNDSNEVATELVDQSQFDGIVDFEKLREVNDDVVAWIYLQDSSINYPVVQCDNNSLYLSQRFDGSWGGCGTLFVDAGIENPFSDMNTIIYGHHMKDGSMFNNLKHYKSSSYANSHPRFEIITPNAKYHLEVISFLGIDAYDEIYRFPTSNADSSVRESYINLIQSKASYSTGVSYGSSDRLVSLSTCAYESDDARYVVIGKLVPWTQEEIDDAIEMHKRKLLDRAKQTAKSNNK